MRALLIAAGMLAIIAMIAVAAAPWRPAPAEPVETTDVRPGPAPAPAMPAKPAERARLVDPDIVPPPALDPTVLERDEPRAPLSELALATPKRRMKTGEDGGKLLFRPVAVGSARFESMGFDLSIAGVESIDPDLTCVSDGVSWPCGGRALGEVRRWLRGRALSCDLPDDAIRGEVLATCRLGNQDMGAWLVSMGWARAVPGGPYEQAGDVARLNGMGVFGPAPVGTLSADAPSLPEAPAAVDLFEPLEEGDAI